MLSELFKPWNSLVANINMLRPRYLISGIMVAVAAAVWISGGLPGVEPSYSDSAAALVGGITMVLITTGLQRNRQAVLSEEADTILHNTREYSSIFKDTRSIPKASAVASSYLDRAADRLLGYYESHASVPGFLEDAGLVEVALDDLDNARAEIAAIESLLEKTPVDDHELLRAPPRFAQYRRTIVTLYRSLDEASRRLDEVQDQLPTADSMTVSARGELHTLANDMAKGRLRTQTLLSVTRRNQEPVEDQVARIRGYVNKSLNLFK